MYIYCTLLYLDRKYRRSLSDSIRTHSCAYTPCFPLIFMFQRRKCRGRKCRRWKWRGAKGKAQMSHNRSSLFRVVEFGLLEVKAIHLSFDHIIIIIVCYLLPMILRYQFIFLRPLVMRLLCRQAFPFQIKVWADRVHISTYDL